MADDTTPGNDPGGPAAAAQPPAEPPSGEASKPAEDDGLKKALNSERQMRAAAEKKLKAFEDAQKSEAEKLAERASTAEARASEAEKQLARFRVATKHNLPAELADRLQGDDEAALEEDAKRLATLVSPAGDLGGRRGGSVGGHGSGSADDINAQIRRMAGRQS
jgi:hypothetical protein